MGAMGARLYLIGEKDWERRARTKGQTAVEEEEEDDND